MVVVTVKDTDNEANNEVQMATEFVVKRIIDHKPDPDNVSPSLILYCIRWYNHPPSQDT